MNTLKRYAIKAGRVSANSTLPWHVVREHAVNSVNSTRLPITRTTSSEPGAYHPFIQDGLQWLFDRRRYHGVRFEQRSGLLGGTRANRESRFRRVESTDSHEVTRIPLGALFALNSCEFRVL